MTPDCQIIAGDCRSELAKLPEKSVHTCVTSPPYHGLRKYEGVEPSIWADGWTGLLGLEPTIDAYVRNIVECFRAVRRVLRDDGTLWLNLGDAYASSPPGNKTVGVSGASTLHGVDSAKYRDTLEAGHAQKRDTIRSSGLPAKNLIGQPWRVAFALQADGWYLRSALPWIKRSAMPESITGSAWIPHKVHVDGEYVECPGCAKCTPNDGLTLRWGAGRPTSALEYMFMFTQSAECFWDAEAVRVKAAPATFQRDKYSRVLEDDGPQSMRHDHETQVDPGGRNFRNTDLFFESLKPPFGMIFVGDEPVGLDVTSAGLNEKHFASFPRKLIRPLILASTSSKGCCPECGTPWVRVVEKSGGMTGHGDWTKDRTEAGSLSSATAQRSQDGTYKVKTLGWRAGCECRWYRPKPDCPEPVLDMVRSAATIRQWPLSSANNAVAHSSESVEATARSDSAAIHATTPGAKPTG